MYISYETREKYGIPLQTDIDQYPDVCPICGKGIEPKFITAYSDSPPSHSDQVLQIVFRCPIAKCDKVFVSYYSYGYSKFYLKESYVPYANEPEIFSEEIEEISPKFIEIYNQAKIAEGIGLNEISGPGYRKSLEFLVKDYLICAGIETKELVGKMELGTAITRIEDENINETSKRAAWLGNDETHYMRKWVDKDMDSLKGLIKLVCNWITNKTLTERIKEDMKDSKPSKTK